MKTKRSTQTFTCTRTHAHAHTHNTRTQQHMRTQHSMCWAAMSQYLDVLGKERKRAETARWRTPSGAHVHQRRLRFTLLPTPGLAFVGADSAWTRARCSRADATAAHQALRMPDHRASNVSCRNGCIRKQADASITCDAECDPE
jgi:hypothetical protein